MCHTRDVILRQTFITVRGVTFQAGTDLCFIADDAHVQAANYARGARALAERLADQGARAPAEVAGVQVERANELGALLGLPSGAVLADIARLRVWLSEARSAR